MRCLLLLAGATAFAQEDFRVAVSAGAWIMSPSGTIQSGITPVDLRTDLDLERHRPTFAGRLVVKPARRHRLWVEGTPYRLSGSNLATRQFTFAGTTYTVREQLDSEASIDYIAGGYQFDLVSRERSHLGLLAGVAYVNATGTVRGLTSGFTGTETQSFPYPVAGADFRTVPWGPLVAAADIKGMSLGDYGHFVQTSVRGGVNLSRHVSFLAGYMLVDADIHRKDHTRGFTPRFSGPVFSIEFRK